MIDLGSAVGHLLLDTSGFQSGFKSAMDHMKTFQSGSSTVSDKFSAMGSALTSVGGTLTKSVTLPLMGLGTTVTAVAANFESSMSKVAAISGLDTAGAEFEALSEKAKEMGATTKFSASEAADAFTYMAMAGWKTNDMLEGIDGIMSLAAASGEDLATTSDIVTDALTAFGLSARDSSHFADILAAASNNANTNVSMLGESFKYVAPVAGALGYSAEDVSVALGLMANSGIKASQAGTALRSAITNMVNPTDNMAAVMEKYNISLTESDGTMKSFGDVMVDLRSKMGGLDEATQAQAASALFGKEAMSGMLAIINASDEDFNKLTESIYNADGTAQQMAETMQDNLGGQLTILKSALEGLAISFGEILIPYITQAVQWLTGIVDRLNSMDEGTKKVIVGIATVVAAIGPLLIVFGKLSSGISSIIGLLGGTGGLSSMLTLITGPIGWVIAAVAALAAAWVTDFGGIQEKTHKVVDIISRWITTFLENLRISWETDFAGIRSFFEVTWKAIEVVFSTVLDSIVWLFEVFDLAFSGDWTGLWDKVSQTAIGIWDWLVSLISGFLNDIVDNIMAIGIPLWEAVRWAFQWVIDGAQEIWDGLMNWLDLVKEDPVEAIRSIGSKLYEAGTDLMLSLWDGLEDIWNHLVDWVWDAIDWIRDKVSIWNDEADYIGGYGWGGSYASGLDYVPRDMTVKVHEGEAIVTKEENSKRTTSGGDTYNFYSPKALTPTEAAREFRKTKQQLVEGMI